MNKIFESPDGAIRFCRETPLAAGEALRFLWYAFEALSMEKSIIEKLCTETLTVADRAKQLSILQECNELTAKNLQRFEKRMIYWPKEGQKRFYTSMTPGKTKYVVSHHNGMKTHDDNSPYYEDSMFRNKKMRDHFISKLIQAGYTEEQ